MRKLANHLATCAMLNEKRVFPVDAEAPCDIRHFDEQACCQVCVLERRHAEIDDPFFGMNFRGGETKFCRIRLAGVERAAQDVPKVGVIVDHLQQGLTAGPALADAEEILGGRIEFCDQQILIEKNDACV
jgi:hypothetical protein